MNVTEFRTRLLAAIHEAKRQYPDAYLYLIYGPELADPLELVKDDRRDIAHLVPLFGFKMEWPKEAWPRLITLDCRRVASYLLESDPGLDDPLLETSITQSHAEIFLSQGVNGTVANDAPGSAENAVCGWIVSPETATQLAARINRNSTPLRHQKPGERIGADQRWVHWYQPEYFSALWSTLEMEQRKALLGPALWLTHSATGELQQFSTDGTNAPPAFGSERQLTHLSVVQWQTMDNVPVVNQLTKQWADLCEQEGSALPRDAAQQLHAHVKLARDLKLDGAELALFVMIAVQLEPGAAETPVFQQMVDETVSTGKSLSEGLRSLPEEFWARYALPVPAPGTHEVSVSGGPVFTPQE